MANRPRDANSSSGAGPLPPGGKLRIPRKSSVGIRAAAGPAPSYFVGAQMGTTAMSRTMNYYPILEEELDNLVEKSSFGNFSWSFAGISCGVVLTLILTKATIPISTLQTDTSSLGFALMVYGPWFFGPLTLVSGLVGGYYLFVRNKKVRKIKASAKAVKLDLIS